MDPEAARQLAAMTEIGQRRSQEGTWAFAIAWPLLAVGFCWGFGLLLGGILSAGLAAAFSRLYIRSRNARIVEIVAAKHGLRRESLDADKYLID